MTNKAISIVLGGGEQNVEWDTENHKFLPSAVRERIFTFFVSLRILAKKTGAKIPRFVVYHIVKMATQEGEPASITESTDLSEGKKCVSF